MNLDYRKRGLELRLNVYSGGHILYDISRSVKKLQSGFIRPLVDTLDNILLKRIAFYVVLLNMQEF